MILRVPNLIEVHQSLAAYLPGGPLWEAGTIPGTNLNALLVGLSGAMLDIETFNYVYMTEFIPSSEGTNFLEDWERALAIPDECFPGPQQNDRRIRRLHVLLKMASLGVQTAADFTRLATLIGYPGTVVKSGIDAGIPEDDGQFTVVINLADEGIGFVYDFPIPFYSSQQTIVECLFRKLIPVNCALQVGAL